MITRTRKQGNSTMITVPKEFNIPDGVEVEPELLDNGIFYKFVEPQVDFLDFSEDLLKDIISEGYTGYEIVNQFKTRTDKLNSTLHNIADETMRNSKPMSKDELRKEIGL